MRICILVPSKDHVRQAGVRIRYQRLQLDLQELGHELEVIPIQSLTEREAFAHDVYIISKCYDARAFLLARLLGGSAKLVGVDLFDDYFSQTYDSLLARYRAWLDSVVRAADFIICSTPAMHSLAKAVAPGLPVRIVNDPAPPLDSEFIKAAARRKAEAARNTGILNIAWFGVGDNPNFPVGLSDLVAFAGDIARMRGRGSEIELHILTNGRAMTADRLAALRRLAVPYTLAAWTEEQEKAVLAKSLICFLPVNGQNFSIVKSLNRAVTALCAGTQVLSSGYPLYEPLSTFIYRDPLKLLKDIEDRRLALREDTVPQLLGLLEQVASPRQEAQKLARFLEEQRALKPGGSTASRGKPYAAVIHGRDTLADVHKFAQWMGALSVSSPFCAQKLDFDLRFQFSADGKGLNCYIADKHCELLEAAVREALSPHGKIGDSAYRKLDLQALSPALALHGTALGRLNSPAAFVASHGHVMAGMAEALERLFPGIVCYHSEHSRLPWWVRPGGKLDEVA